MKHLFSRIDRDTDDLALCEVDHYYNNLNNSEQTDEILAPNDNDIDIVLPLLVWH